MKKQWILLIVFLLCIDQASASKDVVNTITQNTVSQNTVVQSGTAKDWHLTEAEWNHYLLLMQGSSGKYYAHLSPVEVLGINAETNEDLSHFAEVAVKHEHEKIENELRFDRAFNEAAKRLYPNEPIIKPFDMTPYTPIPKNTAQSPSDLRSGDHVVVFADVKANLPLLRSLIDRIKTTPGLVLDIYCLNAADANAIRSWAKANEVPQELVASNRITLNADNGKFNSTVKNGALPYTLLVRGNRSQVIDMDSL